MEPKYEEIIKVINRLVVINEERLETYLWASSEIGELGLRSLFKQFASTSREFSDELKNELLKLRFRNNDIGQKPARVKKAWFDVHEAVAKRDRRKVLLSCEIAEEIMLQEYEIAIDMPGLPEEIRDIVHSQFAELVESHDTIRALRHALVEV